MYKYLRPEKIRRIVKSLRLLKIRLIGKSLRPEKIRRMAKSWRLLKIRRIGKSLRPEKIRRMVKSLQLLKIMQIVKSLQALKSLRSWKCRRPVYCLGSAESPTADFSLVSLMSTFCSSLMWWILHVVSKWREGSGCPAFMADPVPYCTGCLYRPAMPRNGLNPRGNQKSGFCLEFHWFLSNHNNS